ncbi:MAG: hypothetical protein ACLQFR_21070 [Streptosporangiaceae bacterium]
MAAVPAGPRLLADWSEFEVHMKTSLSAGWDRPEEFRHDRAARTSFVADGEAAHGRA